jgi:hypothetical protein
MDSNALTTTYPISGCGRVKYALGTRLAIRESFITTRCDDAESTGGAASA